MNVGRPSDEGAPGALVVLAPGRAPSGGRWSTGFALVELLVVCAVASLMFVALAPDPTAEARRTEAAARRFAWELRALRAEAARTGVHTGLAFTASGGDYEFRAHVDGNDNGVGAGDVRSGIDPATGPRTTLATFARGVRFGVPRSVPDPGGAGTITGGSTPIRFGVSPLVSFAPEGTSTSGTAYLHGEQGTLFAVRVLGTTGRIRVLEWNDVLATWVAR